MLPQRKEVQQAPCKFSLPIVFLSPHVHLICATFVTRNLLIKSECDVSVQGP